MGEERVNSDDEVFPPGEGAAREDEPSGDEKTYAAGVESDEGQRPGDTVEERQPGLLEDPPRAD